jgi:NAD(P)H-dependent FMN reductase
MRLGLLCGSLGPASANAAALMAVADRAREAGVEVVEIDGLEVLPPFSPALVDDPPPAVAAFRARIDAVDPLIVAAPEYAAGVAGWTKNGLDHLVGSGNLYHKLVGVISAGTTGGRHAIEQLVRTVSWQGGLPVATLGIPAPRTRMTGDRITDQATLAELHRFTDRVVAARRGTAEERREAVVALVTPFGIDPARFGEIP